VADGKADGDEEPLAFIGVEVEVDNRDGFKERDTDG